MTTAGRGSGLDDGELLRRFVALRDETAFETLVWRHAGLVYGVCRRVLRNAKDAEDAFQATFLVLARKAAAIGKGGSVGRWLYQVAYRTALRARIGRVRRACVEPLGEEPSDPRADEAVWRDLRSVLDEEVSRLPEKYRAPFVLCYLQGLTCGEVGRELGCPAGTVMTRLARGRERLRARLTRRGIGLPAGVLAAGVLSELAAAPPAEFVSRAAGAGLALLGGSDPAGSAPAHLLSEQVVRAMFVNKVRAAVLAAVAAVVLGAGVTVYSAAPAAGDRPTPPNDQRGRPSYPREPANHHTVNAPARPGDGTRGSVRSGSARAGG